VFVVGYLGDWRPAAEVLFERESLRGDSPPSREARKEIAGTLGARASSGGGFSTDFEVDGGLQPVAARMVAFGEYVDDGTASAMKARDYKDATDLVTQPIALADTSSRDKNQNGSGWKADGTMYTLDTTGLQGVAQPIGLDEEQNAMINSFGTLKARTLGGGFEGTVMQPNMAVRRLTPVECERLQGFPDNYTNIPWRKAIDSPDGPRYKALGNSMAVPVMNWIGKRIELQMPKPAG
jgi:DNA (cytosine-5)-methyltransferase 1